MIIETDVARWLTPAVTLRMRRYSLADSDHDDDDVFHNDHDQNGQSSTLDSCRFVSSSFHRTFLNPCYAAGCLHDDPEKL